MENNCYPFVNLPLPYAYDALEPFLDEKTMHLHHDKHLQTYINNLNEALKDQPDFQKMPLEQLLRSCARMPQKLQSQIRNNGGGVYNHRFYFEGLANPSRKEPMMMLARAICQQYGTLEKFKTEFKKCALSVFGSGYAWLVLNQCGLKLITTANQGTPIEQNLCPILTIDVWEHAYYLKHYNVRAEYIDDWFNIINWEKAEERYLECLHACQNANG